MRVKDEFLVTVFNDIFNDSKPGRKEEALMAKNKARKKEFQTQVQCGSIF